MSLGWWAPVRDSSSEPCAREATQKRSKRITSTWASAAVWLIHSSRFPLNRKYDQEEKLREAPMLQPAPGTAGLLQESCLKSVHCLQGDTALVPMGTKTDGFERNYALKTLFQENHQQEHNIYQKIHLQLDCLLWHFTIVNPLFVLFSTWNYTLYHSLDKGSRVKIFPSKSPILLERRK